MNIEVSSAGFVNAFVELPEDVELPVDGEYLVYCRSGDRSAQAVSIMRDHGFDDITDGGALGDASAAMGIDIVAG